MVGHPVLSSFVVALSIRVAFALVSGVFHDGLLVLDEGQYLLLAQMRAEGEFAPEFWSGYGQSLFDSTRTFMWPVTALFWIFGPVRIVAQLVAALFGAFTAAAAASMAKRFLRPKFALVAGLVVACFPSQILFSSVALRESLIWAGLMTMAVVVIDAQRSTSGRRLILSMTVLGLLFIGLVWLRPHTAVCAIWCAFPALLFGNNHRYGRTALAVCALVFLPWSMGFGIAGAGFGEAAIARLGISRGHMSLTAESGFESSQFELAEAPPLAPTPLSLAPTPLSLAPTGPDGESTQDASAHSDWCVELVMQTSLNGQIGGGKPLLQREAGDWVCAHNSETGRPILIDNRVSASLRRVLPGLYDTLIRPLPWEKSVGRFRSLAGLETVLWIALYGLAAYGTWMNRERYREFLFPVILLALLGLAGAVSHGNLGTSYRHRGQLLAMLAVLAAGGLQALIDGRRSARAVSGP